MPVFRRLQHYLAELSRGRIILWCYAIWYAVSVATHFEPRPRIWLTSMGLSAIIGAALIISTQTAGSNRSRIDPWVVFRLFLMPFCVSSFAALVKDAGYVLVFPPSLAQNLVGVAAIGVFLLLVGLVKRTRGEGSGH
ncbi:MAG TPA: hypothetical protein VD994_00810 [Prosthecobacter sp.]|nr:hypothetical protein [Prosthecobacter sp.]